MTTTTTSKARVIKAKFAGRCNTCGRWFPENTLVLWTPGEKGAVHADMAVCALAAAPAPMGKSAVVKATAVETGTTVATFNAADAPKPTLNGKPIADFLLKAQSDKLRFPSAMFLAPGGGVIKLYVSGARSKFPGSVTVLLNDVWTGRITPEGDVHGHGMTALMPTLAVVAADPAKAATEYGRLHSHCGFCGKGLDDEGSKAVGYGRTCAGHFGLPWHKGGVKELKPVPVDEFALKG